MAPAPVLPPARPQRRGLGVPTKALRCLCLPGAELGQEQSPAGSACLGSAFGASLCSGVSPSLLAGGGEGDLAPAALCSFLPVPHSQGPSGLAQARVGSLLCLNTLLALLLAEENLLQLFKAPEKQEARWKTGDPGIYYFLKSHHFGPDSRLLNVWDGQPRGKVSLLSTSGEFGQEGRTSVR